MEYLLKVAPLAEAISIRAGLFDKLRRDIAFNSRSLRASG